MADFKFQDRGEVSNLQISDDGYLSANVACARTGCQIYTADQIGMEGDHLVTVYRPPEAVFNRDSMATFAGKPVTMGHPSEAVTSENWKTLSIGDIRDDITRDGETIRVGIHIKDAAAVKMIADGIRELSPGYTSPIKMEDGIAPDGTPYQAIQTGPIKINHLAVVLKARGGHNMRIGDDAAHRGAYALPQVKLEDTMSDALKKILFDGMTISVTDQAESAIQKLQTQIVDAATTTAKAIADAQAETATAVKAVETRDGEITALKKQLADAAITPQKLSDMMRKRKKYEKAGKKSGMTEEEMAKMSDEDITRAVVSKSLSDEDFKTLTDEGIAGAFSILSMQDAATEPTHPQFNDGLARPSENGTGFNDSVITAAFGKKEA